LLDLNLSKIEQTASGAVACQICEYIYPGSVPMSKVNWEAKSDFEFVQNYKLLQAAFKKHHVERFVDVEKLIKAKYQDNLEFCQWLKAFFDQSGAYRDNYDPVAARCKGKGADKIGAILNANASKFNSKPLPTQLRTGNASASRSAPKLSSRPTTTKVSPRNEGGLASRHTHSSSEPKGHLTEAVLADAGLMKRNAELTQRITDMELSLAEMEIERDFYFEKLRDVEIMIQVHKEEVPSPIADKLFRIMYATAEEGLTVNDDGEIITK
jgi:microtubule-associated protein, RP/EB family